MQLFGLIGPAHRPLLQVIKQSVDHEFDLTDDDRVAMRQGLLRHEAWVDAPHGHGHAVGAELIGDFITAVDVTRHRGNSHQVGLQIEVDGLDVFVGEHHLVLVFRNGSGDGEQAGEGGIKCSIEVNRAGCQRVGFRIDEVNDASAHENLLWRSRSTLQRSRLREVSPKLADPHQNVACGRRGTPDGPDIVFLKSYATYYKLRQDASG